MSNLNQSLKYFVPCFSFFVLMISVSSVVAVDLPFNPNDYTFLVYDPIPSTHDIQDAMQQLEIPCTVRTSANPVTANDLATHDILIVGWSYYGNTSGLDPDILATCITGRVILTGHDLDRHFLDDPDTADADAAGQLLVQMIDYVLNGSGTGMIALADYGDVFPWLPESWNVSAQMDVAEEIHTFTQAALDSGVYDGLEPNQLSNWLTSVHNSFTGWSDNFVPFELGQGKNDPNAVMTLAAPLFLTKTNADPDNECVMPFNEFLGNYLTYDICYSANGCAIDNVVITETLPESLDYYSSDPVGVYDPYTRTVTWDIGDIGGSDANCLHLVTTVNYAVPGSTLTNTCEMVGDDFSVTAVEETPVCCWAGDILYVSDDANGLNNGTSWDDAYTDLQDALYAAQTYHCCSAIWVAAGTYKPVESTGVLNYRNYSFALPEDVALFGHFAGTESNLSQRNFADPNNETILEGQIGESISYAVYDIVKANGIDNAVFDGFTVQGAYNGSGVYLNTSNISIVNCKFKNNRYYGIEIANYSYPDIHNCTFMDNSTAGVYSGLSQPDISYCTFDGNGTVPKGLNLANGSSINVTNCVFKNYTSNGIYGSNSTLTVADSTFEENSSNGIYGNDLTLTVEGSSFESNHGSALLLSGLTATLTDCSIKTSGDNGITANNSDLTVEHCIIDYCTDWGIFADANSNFTLKGSVVRYCGEYGIYSSRNSVATITNNWIHNNGTDHISSRASGIYFAYQAGIPLVRNNTIYGNYTYGIESTESGTDPNILNCIIYGNGSSDLYRVNGTFDTVNYCNLQNSYSGVGNTTGDPEFMNIATNPDDLHLDGTSQCKDAGNPNESYDELDIDGDNRVCYGRVDMGADEYYWSPADFDQDGFVNFVDHAIFASAWQADSGDSNYNEDCDLEDNNSIDTNDLALFSEEWLWEKTWEESWMMCMSGGGGSFGLERLSPMESSLFLDTFQTIALADEADALMLSTLESIKRMPERLATHTQKFYEIIPATETAFSEPVISAQVEIQQVKEKSIEQQILNLEDCIKFLETLWLEDDQIQEEIDEQQWEDFMKSVYESFDTLLYEYNVQE